MNLDAAGDDKESQRREVWPAIRALEAADIPALDASKISTGILDIARLPQGALERLYIAADETAALALDMQEGDTVQLESTRVMYYCVDAAAGTFRERFREFAAGTAAAAPWAGITGKPDTLAGYGITDAKTAAEIDEAMEGKLDKPNGDGGSSWRTTGHTGKCR